MQISNAISTPLVTGAAPEQDLRVRTDARNGVVRSELNPVQKKSATELAVEAEETGSSEELASGGSASQSVGSTAKTNEFSANRNTVEAQQLEKEQQLIRELAERDREVRNHEQIHASIGGQYAGAPSYSYELGPDGRLYATAGEVKIDTSSVPNDPQATLEKAEIIQRAALSVPEPSSADRQVAAQARLMAAEARAQIVRQEEAERAAANEERAEGAEETEQEREPEISAREAREQADEDASVTAQRLNEFNERLEEINDRLKDVNQRLVDAGVFEKLFPTGTLLDQEA